MSLPRRAPSFWFVLLLLGLDAAVVAGTVRLTDASSPWATLGLGSAGSANPEQATDALPAGDRGWAYCQTYLRWRPVTPISVALTYLEPELDDGITPDEIRSWLGDSVSPAIVDVYALAHKNGSRRVSLELARAKWSGWDGVVGDAEGEAVCNLLRAALLARGIGRPRPPTGEVKPARHDFEFIYARRTKLYQSVEWLGTLEQVLEDGRLDEIQAWLAGEGGP